MVAALRRGLAAEGFVVESAADGTVGLRLAQHGDFDAVVLDVMLPGLSGYEVVRRLRAQANWVPVLMLSAKDGEYDQADGLDVGLAGSALVGEPFLAAPPRVGKRHWARQQALAEDLDGEAA